MTIDSAMALRIRERGWELPLDKDFTVPRLKEIAVRRHELNAELLRLDEEIKTIAETAGDR